MNLDRCLKAGPMRPGGRLGARRGPVDWSSAFCQPVPKGVRCLCRASPLGVEFIGSGGRPLLASGNNLQGRLEDAVRAAIGPELVAGVLGAGPTGLSLYADDLVSLDPFPERYQRLSCRLAGVAPPVYLLEPVAVASRDDVKVAQAHFLALGFEGAAVRHGRAAYECGVASPRLVDVPPFRSATVTVEDVRPGGADYQGKVVLVCRVPQGAGYFDVPAPGRPDFDPKTCAQWYDRRLKISFAEYVRDEDGCRVPAFPVALEFVES